jgi:hypothetical protein
MEWESDDDDGGQCNDCGRYAMVNVNGVCRGCFDAYGGEDDENDDDDE